MILRIIIPMTLMLSFGCIYQAVEYNELVTNLTNEGIEIKVAETLSTMTLEEKVGQLFMSDPGMLTDVWETTEVNETLLENIRKYQPGGFIFFASNIETPEQTKQFISDLQSASKHGLIIAVDEEGGLVSRVGANSRMNFKWQPAMRQIGETGDPQVAYQVGAELGSGLHNLGFTMNFAPVADVDTNPDNPVIGSRSFGSDPSLVSEFVVQKTNGLQENNVSAVIKHFPGHGDSYTDSHTGAVSLPHNRERLDSIEFAPFRAGIQAGVDAVMIGHIALPSVTGDNTPATISYEIVTGILREEMGFDGLVVTDSLSMGAVSMYYELPDFCVQAILAGNDLLLLQTNPSKGSGIAQFDAAYNAVLTAVRDGVISEERLNESVTRILHVRYSRQ